MIGLTGLFFLALLFTIAITVVMPLFSYEFQLYKPVDCAIGTECFIQNYVDVDPGKGWQDYTCGPLAYEGHKGTDFRAKNLAAMKRGIGVLAAADGTVLATRDGMDDRSIRDSETGLDDVKARECGNGVVLQHPNGYQTQYCHLKEGSIAVKKGDEVKHGHKLGEMGLSGQTEFPHLHLAVRDKDSKVIDPFLGPVETMKCGANGRNLWHPSVRKELEYRSSGLLGAGFATVAPTVEMVRSGELDAMALSADSEMIVFWADAFGLRKGDTLYMALKGPDGSLLTSQDTTIEGNKAVYFQFIGKRRHAEDDWTRGEYQGRYKVIRKTGQKVDTVIDETVTLTVEP